METEDIIVMIRELERDITRLNKEVEELRNKVYELTEHTHE